ncbi:MAG TPA: glycosyltransferase family 39 protein [Pyrinomonadaceae bacterium]|jgi:4-amino-4-deoxy-L-arabinose transferase-like glycosyltransferase|nr:glycosyltransferase family 39 protein [Pyrinomonadaceae bacterium]
MEEEKKRERGSGASSLAARWRAELLCALLLALAAGMMLQTAWRKSLTIDEPLLIAAGYYHLAQGDYRPVNEHPPFAKSISAVPLLLAGAEGPPIDPAAQHDYEYFLNLFDDFWRANKARYEWLTFVARVPAVLVTVLLGALVFVYARRYWGERAALFAVALFAFEPTVLAHGRVVQTDVPSALALLLFSFTLYEYLKGPATRRAVYTGLAAGFAAVTKFSMIVLGPVVLVASAVLILFAPRWKLGRGRAAALAVVVALAAVLAVNAAYLFHRGQPEPFGTAMARSVVPQHLQDPLYGPLSAGYRALQTVFPADFVSGIGWQLAHAHNGHPAGLLGMHSVRGWWYYFPIAFALKTTLPFLLVSVAAVLWALLGLRRGAEGRVLVLLIPLALFTLLLMMSTINIGVRYYLPAYPFLLILGGAFLDDFMRRGRHRLLLSSLVVVGLLCWGAVEAGRAHPDHMTYMNQLAYKWPHWWYLSDSNVEWGDDIRDMALYLRARGERRVGAALLNWQVFELYDIEQAALVVPPGERPERTRYTAVGASLLNGSTMPGGFDTYVFTPDERVNYFDQYRRRTPEKVFGGSIYLFKNE